MGCLMGVFVLEKVKVEKVLMEEQWKEVEGRVVFAGAVELS